MITSETDRVIEKIRENAATPTSEELERAASYTLADAMREGASVTDQAYSEFGYGARACGWSGAGLAARARGYLE